MDDDYNPDIITLSDDDGQEYQFEVLDAIETDEGRYVALMPMYDDPEDAVQDSGELIVLRAYEEDGENYFESIEDDDEYGSDVDFDDPDAPEDPDELDDLDYEDDEDSDED